MVWSPDSSRIAAYRVKPGYRRLVHYVESSPEDQLQPKHATFLYTKPGDVLDLERPTLFHVASKTQMVVSDELFPNPYDLSSLVWRKDSRGVTFEYNQRGHAVYRVIEVDAATGKARAVISEEPKTFFYYNQANHTRSAGKRFRDDIDDGKEVIWMSERDGWNHFYLIDGATGAVRNQITKGEWAVRGVARVDHEQRQIYFSAGGMYPGRDPYLLHYYRINFDGTGLTPLTAGGRRSPSADSRRICKYYVDTYSRVDLAPVSELRRLEDASLVAEIERGDITELVKSGWKAPEVFVAKGRDGKTDIWGIIVRPTSFDPAKKYPGDRKHLCRAARIACAEDRSRRSSAISRRPSSASSWCRSTAWARRTARRRSMMSHGRTLATPDSPIASCGTKRWPPNIRRTTSSRVGIYGGSAGGQNSLGALLFHPEFYKVAVSYVGCHDNRMDKLWWNEQWMGWPIGPQYSASSNVDNAWRLQGRVLLVAAELDTNVDPSSTYQVANALIKANKTFDMLVIPGGSHGAGRSAEHPEYGERKRFDFFVQHLLGQQPPDWNQSVPSKTSTADGPGLARERNSA